MKAVLALLLLAAGGARGAVVVPVAGVELLGGQYFFRGDKGSFSGNASAFAAPAIVYDDQWTLLPSVSSSYEGTKRAVDLVGAGTLFQQSMDHRAGASVIFRPRGTRWRFKQGAYYRMRLMKETADERWLDGLFDLRMAGTSLEGECFWNGPHSIRAVYDFNAAWFPNYRSLESQAGLDFRGRPLARELAGESVLNSRTHMLTLAAGYPAPFGAAGTAFLRFSRRDYPDQPVVAATGLLSGGAREDLTTALGAGLSWEGEANPDWGLRADLDLSVENTVSNQNDFDAARLEFTPHFYNAYEWRISPALRSSFGDDRSPIVWSLGLDYARRRAPHRGARDAAGGLTGEALTRSRWTVSNSLSYPMGPGLSFLAMVRIEKASSNQDFENYYSYDYSTANYLFGFKYDY